MLQCLHKLRNAKNTRLLRLQVTETHMDLRLSWLINKTGATNQQKITNQQTCIKRQPCTQSDDDNVPRQRLSLTHTAAHRHEELHTGRQDMHARTHAHRHTHTHYQRLEKKTDTMHTVKVSKAPNSHYEITDDRCPHNNRHTRACTQHTCTLTDRAHVSTDHRL